MRPSALLPAGLLLSAVWSLPASAQSQSQPDPGAIAPDAAAPTADLPPVAQDGDLAPVAAPDMLEPEEERRLPLFPLGAKEALERGFRLPPAFGISGMYIHNVQNMQSSNLAVAFGIGSDPPEDAKLISVPFVTTTLLESHSSNTEFKADLWVFPFLNVFAGVGKVRGHVDIGVDIDLDAFVPPPFCRPAKPCGHVDLPFVADMDNTAATLGAIAGYGSQDWFAALAFAKTLSISSKDRSNIETTNVGLRFGPRLHLNDHAVLSPYVGANYFKFDAVVSGVVRSGPVLPDAQTVNLRYSVELTSENPWSIINGVNVELNRHWSMQAEYNWGQGSDRVVMTATFRP